MNNMHCSVFVYFKKGENKEVSFERVKRPDRYQLRLQLPSLTPLADKSFIDWYKIIRLRFYNLLLSHLRECCLFDA